jgi:hypothetical protein
MRVRSGSAKVVTRLPKFSSRKHPDDYRRRVPRYRYFFSSSAKKASESRTKSASLSFTSSLTLSFSTDLSGGSLSEAPADIGHPGSLSTCSLPLVE